MRDVRDRILAIRALIHSFHGHCYGAFTTLGVDATGRQGFNMSSLHVLALQLTFYYEKACLVSDIALPKNVQSQAR